MNKYITGFIFLALLLSSCESSLEKQESIDGNNVTGQPSVQITELIEPSSKDGNSF